MKTVFYLVAAIAVGVGCPTQLLAPKIANAEIPILTPVAAKIPRINGPKVFGVRPGHFNDPNMLVFGIGGWGKPHPTHLTPDEQYTQISMWSSLSDPLLLGCDLTKLDPFTYSLIPAAARSSSLKEWPCSEF